MGGSGRSRSDRATDVATRRGVRGSATGVCRDCGVEVLWATCTKPDGSTYKRPLTHAPGVGEWFVFVGVESVQAKREPWVSVEPIRYRDHRDICAGSAA